MKRIAILMNLNNEEAAIEKYKKYVTKSSLVPRCTFAENKIIIRKRRKISKTAQIAVLFNTHNSLNLKHR